MKKLGVIGAGESGIGSTILAKEKGWDVFVSDFGKISCEVKDQLFALEVRFEEEGHSLDILAACDVVVKSPGVPDTAAIIRDLLDQGVSVISEIEFAFDFLPEGAKVVGITGSNGKTTTTNLVHHLLAQSDKTVVKGGNLGKSFARLICEGYADIYVVELSSFQLDGIVSFRPDVAVILNITPDHLDRYSYDFELYADSKLRITQNLNHSDLLIANESSEATRIRIGDSAREFEIKWINNNRLQLQNYAHDNPYLRGEHNNFNATVAIEIARRFGIAESMIAQGLKTFVNDDHRMQSVAVYNDIEWINDSKATNVDSCFYALSSIDKPIIWILGGVDKGNNYDVVKDLVDARVKLIVALGLDNSKVIQTFEQMKEVYSVRSMAEAVRVSKEKAEKGDVVLLSPACASFDLFNNYKDRGNQFIQQVKNQHALAS